MTNLIPPLAHLIISILAKCEWNYTSNSWMKIRNANLCSYSTTYCANVAVQIANHKTIVESKMKERALRCDAFIKVLQLYTQLLWWIDFTSQGREPLRLYLGDRVKFNVFLHEYPHRAWATLSLSSKHVLQEWQEAIIKAVWQCVV